MRIGIWGGCFNPPTLGHLICAESARDQLGLDMVLFVPVGEPSHKELEGDPGRDGRVELVEAAIAGVPDMGLSRIEVDRPGRSYMTDTLNLLIAAYPDAELWLMMGGDEALSFKHWRDPSGILAKARLGVCTRIGVTETAISAAFEELGGADRIDLFEMPTIEISSTDVRARVRQGRSIRFLVPAAVEGLIEARGLYR